MSYLEKAKDSFLSRLNVFLFKLIVEKKDLTDDKINDTLKDEFLKFLQKLFGYFFLSKNLFWNIFC